MSDHKRLIREAIKQIKEALGMSEQPPFELKDVYLKKDEDVIGLHAVGDKTETGFHQYEAWANLYDPSFKFLGSIYRIFGPIEEEADNLKKDGWVEIPAPSKEKT